jgi:glycosyltransferase involved in cell wall biosynthesis
MSYNAEGHHFTVVIPTRERCDTLEHTLHTCVMQNYDRLDILVSDNFSHDRTREVVESYKDPRIHYINTGKRLSMTDNYEFALSHVRPEGYVLYIGDDDGLLPDAIRDINKVVTDTGASVLRWDIADYGWPSHIGDCKNRLVISSLDSKVTKRDSLNTIKNVLSFKDTFRVLPLMYMESAIAHDLIKRIKASSGRFYHSMIPDVYSGFAIAGSIASYYDSQRPYVIGGSSHHSSGAGYTGISLGAPAQKFLAEDNLPFHKSLVFIAGSIPMVVIESYLQARDHLPLPGELTIDMEKLAFLIMQEAAPKTEDLYGVAKDSVLQLGQMHNIPEAAERAIKENPKREPGSGRRLTVRNLANAGLQMARLFLEDMRKHRFYLDCSSLNVKNIYDASLLCNHILKLRDMNVLGDWSVLKSSLNNIKRIIAPGE